MVAASGEGNPKVDGFECSVFNGEYITGDVDKAYLEALEQERNDANKANKEKSVSGEGALIGLHNDVG